MRTFAKFLLSVLGSILAFIALSGLSMWLLVGTAGHATSTVISLISEEVAGREFGGALVDRLAGDSLPPLRNRIEKERGLLADAAAVSLRASETAISLAIHASYFAVEQGSTAVIDLKPVVSKALTEMHKVDPVIPAVPGGGLGTTESLTLGINGPDLAPIRTALAIICAWWVVLILALVALILAGLCDARAPIRRWRTSGISLAIPSGLLLLLSFAAGAFTGGTGTPDASVAGLFDSVIRVVQGTLLRSAGLAFLLAVTLIIVTVVVNPADRPKNHQPID